VAHDGGAARRIVAPMRPARNVEVDLRGADGERVPIVGGRRSYVFGEPAVAEVEGQRLRGVIGWDPRLGWVLVLDEPAPPPPPDA
jgi:hypothetical protein